MKKNLLVIVIAVVFLAAGYVLGTYVPLSKATGSASLNSEMDTLAYSIGIDLGNMVTQTIDQMNISEEYSNPLTKKGFDDGLSANEDIIPRSQAQMIIQQYMMKKNQEMAADEAVTAQENLIKGQEFLESNKEREEVTVTQSGLQYEIIEEGRGPKPSETDTVTVHYTGSLIDGTVFQTTEETGEPATFPVTGVIPGWTEALLRMNEGAKWKIYVPSELAYGSQQRSEDILPNSTLIFEIELVDVQEK